MFFGSFWTIFASDEVDFISLSALFYCSFQALQGLSCIHSMNIIHRDIKPANLLLASANQQRPRLLVADFGVAEIFQETVNMGSGVKGTFAPAPQRATIDIRMLNIYNAIV